MKLKTTTKEACAMDTAGIISLESTQEQLLRGGFKTTDRYSTMLGLRLDGDKPGEAYDVLFPRDGFRGDWFVRIHKGAVAASKSFDGFVAWDISNTIILKLV